MFDVEILIIQICKSYWLNETRLKTFLLSYYYDDNDVMLSAIVYTTSHYGITSVLF